MDKNQAIGLVLAGLLIIIYFQFFAPQPVPPGVDTPVEEQRTEDTVSRPQAGTTGDVVRPQEDRVAMSDSMQNAINEQRYGIFAPAAKGSAQEVSVSSEDMSLAFSTQGGRISQVVLKHYKSYDKEPLRLLDQETSQISLLAGTASGNINLQELYYTTEAGNVSVQEGDTAAITFTANLDGGRTLKQIYTVPGNGYQIGYELQVSDPAGVLSSNTLTFVWKDALRELEKDIEESRRRSALTYYTAEGDLEKIASQGANEEDTEQVEEPLRWVSMKQRFFSSAIVAKQQPFTGGTLSVANPESSSHIVKTMGMEVGVPVENGRASFSYYFGPNDLQVMRSVAPSFEENIDFGWPVVKWISKYVIAPMFSFFERFIGSYGVIIVILVLLIKTVLFPLSYKSYLSMAKIKVLKPDLDEIKEKYGDDAQKAQAEQMQLYQKVGVNPLSGCVPVVLQMPILLAMFNFFPNSIELRQEPFLWTDDLSTYDSILDLPFKIPFYGDHVSLFVLLMTASTILYTWSNNQVTTVQGPMKSMQYFLPIIFMFVLNSFPAALSFYYFVSNIVTFAQQAIIRRFVDDDKIRKILDENKKRNGNKKKSKFQQRLEGAMKATEEAKRTKNKPVDKLKATEEFKRKNKSVNKPKAIEEAKRKRNNKPVDKPNNGKDRP